MGETGSTDSAIGSSDVSDFGANAMADSLLSAEAAPTQDLSPGTQERPVVADSTIFYYDVDLVAFCWIYLQCF